jgi:hypothetical protein
MGGGHVEQIVFTAWFQRRQARRLTRDIKAIFRDPELYQQNDDDTIPPRAKPGPDDIEPGQVEEEDKHDPTAPNAARPPTLPRRIHEWTQLHSFLVVMGGIAIDTTSLPPPLKFLPGSLDRVVLTPSGLQQLARSPLRDLLPDVSESTIRDKSKANALAKTIVCVQASWFSLQCVVRLVQGVSVSLLELNTFAHAICALVIYFLWWNKPLDIEEPILVTDRRVDGLCAAFCYRSLFYGCRDVERVQLRVEGRGWNDTPLGSGETRELVPGRLVEGAAVPLMAKQPPRSSRQTRLLAGLGLVKMPDHAHYTRRDTLRWKMQRDESRSGVIDAVCARRGNFPVEFKIKDFENLIEHTEDSDGYGDGIPFVVAFVLAGCFYGGIHAIAWNYPFTGHSQRLLWQLSAITTVSPCPALVAYGMTLKALMVIDTKYFSVDDSWTMAWIVLTFVALIFLYLLLYVLARLYLVVECFISLAYLPPVVFTQPHWVYYFPHMS